MIQPVDFVVKSPAIEHAFLWPADVRGAERPAFAILCDLCEEPVTWGERVVGYPKPGRVAFVVHGSCWQQCAARLAKLLEVYA